MSKRHRTPSINAHRHRRLRRGQKFLQLRPDDVTVRAGGGSGQDDQRSEDVGKGSELSERNTARPLHIGRFRVRAFGRFVL